VARGGFRQGAGRPKKPIIPVTTTAAAVRVAARKAGMTPLDYMLDVMNDTAADSARRDRMAIAAAPFVHPRADTMVGKKDRARAAAKTAGEGTAWGDDLGEPQIN
jgi:hypothetical protein